MNSKLAVLLDHYSASHQNPRNQLIHKVAVPLILFNLLGLLSQIAVFGLNFAWVAIVSAFAYYFQFRNFKVYLTISLQLIPIMLIIHFNPAPPVPFYTGIFIIGWIAQFVGHKIEGRKPSFFEDLQYLLIGPIWILKGLL